jgi:hypothetical protein
MKKYTSSVEEHCVRVEVPSKEDMDFTQELTEANQFFKSLFFR